MCICVTLVAGVLNSSELSAPSSSYCSSMGAGSAGSLVSCVSSVPSSPLVCPPSAPSDAAVFLLFRGVMVKMPRLSCTVQQWPQPVDYILSPLIVYIMEYSLPGMNGLSRSTELFLSLWSGLKVNAMHAEP